MKNHVLIVGAGPTGLALALLLLKRGIPFRLIEEKKEPEVTSRALGIHARTLELFERMGIVNDFLKEGLHCDHLNFHDNGNNLSINLKGIDSPYPYVLLLPQTKTEEILRKHLEKNGGTIEWDSSLVSFENDSAVLSAKGKMEHVKPAWVVGCDGAHSKVRHLLNIPFVGAEFSETFLLADCKVKTSVAPTAPQGFFSSEGISVIAPLPNTGHFRLIFPLRNSQEDLNASPDSIQTLVTKRGLNRFIDIEEYLWISKFHIHRRLANHFRQGVAFLAGDAAHIHSPVGGQGMNTSLQDAANLAWKLALAVEGVASANLLNTYEEERLPIAEEVLEGTTRATHVITFLQHRSCRPLFRLLLFFLRFPAIQKHLSRNISEISIHYRNSSLNRYEKRDLFWNGPQVGERAPNILVDKKMLFDMLDPMRFTLLLFDDNAPLVGEIAKRYGKWIDVFVATDEASLKKYAAGLQSMFLIRPDGYIGYRSRKGKLEELNKALHSYFSPSL